MKLVVVLLAVALAQDQDCPASIASLDSCLDDASEELKAEMEEKVEKMGKCMDESGCRNLLEENREFLECSKDSMNEIILQPLEQCGADNGVSFANHILGKAVFEAMKEKMHEKFENIDFKVVRNVMKAMKKAMCPGNGKGQWKKIGKCMGRDRKAEWKAKRKEMKSMSMADRRAHMKKRFHSKADNIFNRQRECYGEFEDTGCEEDLAIAKATICACARRDFVGEGAAALAAELEANMEECEGLKGPPVISQQELIDLGVPEDELNKKRDAARILARVADALCKDGDGDVVLATEPPATEPPTTVGTRAPGLPTGRRKRAASSSSSEEDEEAGVLVDPVEDVLQQIL